MQPVTNAQATANRLTNADAERGAGDKQQQTTMGKAFGTLLNKTMEAARENAENS